MGERLRDSLRRSGAPFAGSLARIAGLRDVWPIAYFGGRRHHLESVSGGGGGGGGGGG